ncbi:FtsX-like permease family protein [Ottowia sp.]|uniref:ABC transporter permease n=1 Tax=Ottowia sp. TaxID=1898956 RepID=UPI0025EB6C83|nr:FtsX-like permease family protein [Ottowia sp.]MBK6616490.1 ABC transporter permease [Ottowia sp.]
MKWLRFAFLNTLRNRRRSVVTVAIAALGTAAVLLAGGFALYTYESLGQSAARMSGHLIVGTPEQFTQEEDVPLQHGASDWRAVAKQLLADTDVRSVLPSISFGGLASNGDKSVVMIGLGVDPASEFKVKGPFLKMLSGDVLSEGAGASEVMLGEGVAKSLKARPGTGLTLLATTTDGAMNALDVTVKGVFSTGIPDVDKRLVYVDLPSTQRLLHSDRVSSLGVFLNRMEKTDASQARLASGMPSMTVRTWKEEAFFYASVKQLYNRIFGSLGIIICLIVVFVVTNAMAMSIIERTREIGTLRAIGTLPSQLTLSLALEGMLLGTAGAVVGCILSVATSLLLYVFPIQMPPPPGRSTSYPLNISIDPTLYALAMLGMVVLATAASAVVARGTVNKSITEALAHT